MLAAINLVALDNLITSLAWREVLWWLIPFAIYNALMALFNFSLEFSLRLKGVPKAILFTTVTVVLVVFSFTGFYRAVRALFFILRIMCAFC